MAEDDTLFLMIKSYFLHGLISNMELTSNFFCVFVLYMYYAMQISSHLPFAEVRGMIMCDLYHLVEIIFHSCFMHYDL